METFETYNNSFDELSQAIHRYNIGAGWWDDTPEDIVYTKLMLVVTEIAEATEGERKDLMDDHLPHRKMAEVELADVLIRMLDLAGYAGWVLESPGEYESFVDKAMYAAKNHHPVSQHLTLVRLVTEIISSIENDSSLTYMFYTLIVKITERIAAQRGYDVMGALFEKWEYNKTRIDHTPEARAATGGKSV